MRIKSIKINNEVKQGDLEKIIHPNIPINSIVLDNDNKVVSNFIDYCSIETDIEFVTECIAQLIEIRINENNNNKKIKDKKLILKRSLFISSIISYGKCFNKSKGRISLDKNIFKKNFPYELLNKENTLDFHKNIITLRNKLIAHSDTHPFEKTIAFIEFEKSGNFLDIKLNYLFSTKYSFDERELENFLVLSGYLLKQIQVKKDLISKKILSDFGNEELLNKGIDILRTNVNK